MPRKTRLTLILIPLIALGCASERQPEIEVLPANQVFISRLIPDSSSPRHDGCGVGTLDHAPGATMREIGTINLAGTVPNAADVIALVDQKACDMDANAVLITQIQERSAESGVNYNVTARAFAAKSGNQSAHRRRAAVVDIETDDTQARTIEMNPPEPASEQPTVIPQPDGGQSWQEQIETGNGSEQSQSEVLMRPASPDAAGAAAQPDQRGGAAGISESSIPPTEAAPLSAEPSPTSTSTAAPAPPKESAAESTPAPSPEESSTPENSPSSTPAESVTPTPVPSAMATSVVPPSPSPAPTASSAPAGSFTPAASTPAASPTPIPSSSPSASPSASPETPAEPTDSPTSSATATSDESVAAPEPTESPMPTASPDRTGESIPAPASTEATTPSDTASESETPAPSNSPTPRATATAPSPASGGSSGELPSPLAL